MITISINPILNCENLKRIIPDPFGKLVFVCHLNLSFMATKTRNYYQFGYFIILMKNCLIIKLAIMAIVRQPINFAHNSIKDDYLESCLIKY